MSIYKFELHERIRIKDTILIGTIKGRHTTIAGSKHKEIKIKYTIDLDVMKGQHIWYEEDCLVLATETCSKQHRKLLIPPRKS